MGDVTPGARDDVEELIAAVDAHSFEQVSRWHDPKGTYATKPRALLTAVTAALSKLKEERDGLQQTFDLRWKADQRAIAMWQALNPGNDLTWPDRADMVVWLLDKLDAIEASEVTGWPWPDENTLGQMAELSGRDRASATQLAIDLGKTFGVPAGFAAHHYVADKGAERAREAEALSTKLVAGIKEAIDQIAHLHDQRARLTLETLLSCVEP